MFKIKLKKTHNRVRHPKFLESYLEKTNMKILKSIIAHENDYTDALVR